MLMRYLVVLAECIGLVLYWIQVFRYVLALYGKIMVYYLLLSHYTTHTHHLSNYLLLFLYFPLYFAHNFFFPRSIYTYIDRFSPYLELFTTCFPYCIGDYPSVNIFSNSTKENRESLSLSATETHTPS